jgi:hypothetical protein
LLAVLIIFAIGQIGRVHFYIFVFGERTRVSSGQSWLPCQVSLLAYFFN